MTSNAIDISHAIRSAGAEPKVAEAIARAITAYSAEQLANLAEQLANSTEHLATKAEMAQLDAKNAQLDAKLDAKIENCATKTETAQLDAKIEHRTTKDETLRLETKFDNHATKADIADLKADNARLDAKIDRVEQTMLIYLKVIAGLVGVGVSLCVGIVLLFARGWIG